MQEHVKMQEIPVKVYRTSDRVMIATPMPGLKPEDIKVDITEGNHLILHGELRGLLKDVKELLIDEWSIGYYYRELPLPNTVDGEQATLTYGNGVLVVALPLCEQTRPARLTLATVGPAHGERVGNCSNHEHPASPR